MLYIAWAQDFYSALVHPEKALDILQCQAATMDAFMAISCDFATAAWPPNEAPPNKAPPYKAPPAERPRRSQGRDPRMLAAEAQRRLMAARGSEAEPLEVKKEPVVAKDEPGVMVKDEPVEVNPYIHEVHDETNKMRRRPKKRRRRRIVRRRRVWATKDEEEA